MTDTSTEFRKGERVHVRTKFFGIVDATIAGYYPNADKPYVNLWLITGYPGASYTTTPDNVFKVGGCK